MGTPNAALVSAEKVFVRYGLSVQNPVLSPHTPSARRITALVHRKIHTLLRVLPVSPHSTWTSVRNRVLGRRGDTGLRELRREGTTYTSDARTDLRDPGPGNALTPFYDGSSLFEFVGYYKLAGGEGAAKSGYKHVMNDALTYHAAVQMLPRSKNRLVALLNAVAATGLTTWAVGDPGTDDGAAAPGAPMSIPVMKDEVIGFAQQTLQAVPDWCANVSRFTRSERLTAVHAVIVVSSFFEALADGFPVPVELLMVSAPEQAMPPHEGKLPDGYVEMVEFLLREPLPLPEPHRPYADVCGRLRDCYAMLSDRLVKWMSDLAVWDEFDTERKVALREAVGSLPVRALDGYVRRYHSLAAGNKEFEVWAGMTEVPASSVGLTGLPSHLADMAIRRPGQRSRSPLALSYQAALAEPVIGSGQAPDGVVLPPLEEAYVDPVCRVADVGHGDRPSEAEWWERREQLPDIDAFLAGYLTSLRATKAPLVVLGEPGSGKSKLVEVLAARLPEQDFLPVLVQLRDVAAESMVQEQIEQGIIQGPGRHVSWHDALETAEGALPVVLLDGLDELIQATAVNRYDYLEQVRDFQLRQARIGRPVAVVVTSRTVVADQVRFPSGSLALQLQPFTDNQVRLWLGMWERHNFSGLAARGLRSLPVEVALAHRELTEQPLLLLLVAIFDAADNSLQHLDSRLGRAELYERLITEFAGREVAKTARNRALPATRQRLLAQREVHRLAIVALAMFARGQQAASEAELNQDLPVLFTEEDEAGGDSELTLTSAQRATGRFFFVHKSEARLRDERVRSYEFLHATFGEFLVARLAVSALRDIAVYREVTRRATTAAGQLDDGFLYAALSFSCLVSRTPIISFMEELLQQISADEREACREILSELIAGSLVQRPNRSFHQYEPVECTTVRRLACYSANLVVMLVLLVNGVRASEFLGSIDTAKKWTQYGHLWRSAFTSSEWRSFIDAIRAQASRAAGFIDIMLSQEVGSPVSPTDSILVTDVSGGLTNFGILLSAREDASYVADIPFSSIAGYAFRNIAFIPEWHSSMLLLHSVPYLRAVGGEVRYQHSDGTYSLPGYMFAHLDYSRDADPGTRRELYETYAGIMAASPELKEQFLSRLRQDMPGFPVTSVVGILRKMDSYVPVEMHVRIVNALWERAYSESDKESVVDLVLISVRCLAVRARDTERGVA